MPSPQVIAWQSRASLVNARAQEAETERFLNSLKVSLAKLMSFKFTQKATTIIWFKWTQY